MRFRFPFDIADNVLPKSGLKKFNSIKKLSLVSPVFLQHGLLMSQKCFDCMPPRTHEITTTILYSSAAGAVLGGSIGASFSGGNPIAASSGALVGGAAGFAAGVIAVSRLESV